MTGLGGAILASGMGLPVLAQSPVSLNLRARPGKLAKTEGFEPPIWLLETANPGPIRVPKGDLAVALANELPAPIVLNWLGIERTGGRTADRPIAHSTRRAGHVHTPCVRPNDPHQRSS